MRFRQAISIYRAISRVDIGYTLKDGKIIIGEGDNWLEIGCEWFIKCFKNVK